MIKDVNIMQDNRHGEDQLLRHFSNNLNTALIPLEKDKFRSRVYAEDISDELLYNCKDVIWERVAGHTMKGIKVLSYPILLFDTFNPFAHIIHKKISSDTITLEEIQKYGIVGYENPGLYEGISKNLTGVIAGLALINNGITEKGIKLMTNYVMATHVKKHTIEWNTLNTIITTIVNTDIDKIWDFIDEEFTHKLKNRIVFYPKSLCIGEDRLTAEEKREITLRELRLKLKKQRRSYIDTSIEFLEEKDSFTNITNVRISKVSGLNPKTVGRSLSSGQKRLISKINVTRLLSTEKATNKFNEFVQNIEQYSTARIATKKLSISTRDYYKFLRIIELITTK